jgi:phage anti-repressor protein
LTEKAYVAIVTANDWAEKQNKNRLHSLGGFAAVTLCLNYPTPRADSIYMDPRPEPGASVQRLVSLAPPSTGTLDPGGTTLGGRGIRVISLDLSPRLHTLGENMNEIIVVKDDVEGMPTVSARELYDKLGLPKQHWARWSKNNIELNPFAVEGEDWVTLPIVGKGYETKDFDISIALAKKLCMLTKTEVGEKIRNYFIECERVAKQSEQNIPYHLRRHMANVNKIPHTHFSILTELIIKLIAPLEALGYTMPDNMLPDISEGRMFCKYLRDKKGINTDILPTYEHIYEDGRVVYPKLYPIEIYPDFVNHFFGVWLPNKSEEYFSKRDPNALPFLGQHIHQLPASTIQVNGELSAPDED